MDTGAWLVILGIENQTHIDFLMPFRVYELNFINLARQVEDIRKKHLAERKEAKEQGRQENDRKTVSSDEYLGLFYSDDKLNPVITLVIYYGEEEWKRPLKLSDLFVETPFNLNSLPACDYTLTTLGIFSKNIENRINLSL